MNQEDCKGTAVPGQGLFSGLETSSRHFKVPSNSPHTCQSGIPLLLCCSFQDPKARLALYLKGHSGGLGRPGSHESRAAVVALSSLSKVTTHLV